MAVSVDTLRTALRLGDTAEERALATRLLKTAKIVVEKQAPPRADCDKRRGVYQACGLLVRHAQCRAGRWIC